MTSGEAAPQRGRRKATRAQRSPRTTSGRARSSDNPRRRAAAAEPDRPARGRTSRGRTSRERALGAPGLPRPSLRSRGWRIALVAAAVALLAAWLAWYAATPEPLPTSSRTVNATGAAGKPLYVGMFTAPDDFGRTLRISGVKVHTTSNAEITVTPVLCRRGTVGVTTDPDQFCAELVNPEGERLVGGDSIVLEVESDDPALAIIDRIRIAYREDIRWGTQEAGHHQAIVSVASGNAQQ